MGLACEQELKNKNKDTTETCEHTFKAKITE